MEFRPPSVNNHKYIIVAVDYFTKMGLGHANVQQHGGYHDPFLF